MKLALPDPRPQLLTAASLLKRGIAKIHLPAPAPAKPQRKARRSSGKLDRFIDNAFLVVTSGAFLIFLVASLPHVAYFFATFEPQNTDGSLSDWWWAVSYLIAAAINITEFLLSIKFARELRNATQHLPWYARAIPTLGIVLKYWPFMLIISGFSWAANLQHAREFHSAMLMTAESVPLVIPFFPDIHTWGDFNPYIVSAFPILNIAYTLMFDSSRPEDDPLLSPGTVTVLPIIETGITSIKEKTMPRQEVSPVTPIPDLPCHAVTVTPLDLSPLSLSPRSATNLLSLHKASRGVTGEEVSLSPVTPRGDMRDKMTPRRLSLVTPRGDSDSGDSDSKSVTVTPRGDSDSGDGDSKSVTVTPRGDSDSGDGDSKPVTVTVTPRGDSDSGDGDRDITLERAYQAIRRTGTEPSSRKLAQETGIGRNQCNAWLAVRKTVTSDT